MSTDSGPNAAEARYWSDEAGPRWVRFGERMDAQLEPVGAAALAAAGVRLGEHVVDIGCGAGATTAQLGRLVGSQGSVVGVDISTSMLARARERAAAEGLAHVRFEEADAQVHPFPLFAYDLAFSRFGVMFFADPVTAFANIRHGLVRGGRLVFVCWRAMADNAWASIPTRAVADALELALPPSLAGQPGPYAFADEQRLRRILQVAGYGDVSVDRLDVPIVIGGSTDLDDAVATALEVGPVRRLLAGVPADVVPQAADALHRALAAHHGPDGVVLGGSAWLVRAHP